MQWRRKSLLQEATGRWLKVALNFQDQRLRLSSRQQVEKAERIWKLVAKLARHWKMKVRCSQSAVLLSTLV